MQNVLLAIINDAGCIMAAQQHWRVAFSSKYGVVPDTHARARFLKNVRFADNTFWWVGPAKFSVGGKAFDPIEVGSVMMSAGVSRGTCAHLVKAKEN